jgi:hypothetical protein
MAMTRPADVGPDPVSAMFPRDRLSALLGMLGSDHDGEVLNAGRLASRLIRGAGLTWDQVLTVPSGPARPPPDPPKPPDWRSAVAACCARTARLTQWERDFLAELATYRHAPSDRQTEILGRIHARVTAA